MWLILSVKQEGFITRDEWTTELEKSTPFASKDDALDFVRAEIMTDQGNEVMPIFVGARVVELKEQGRFALRKFGHVTNMGAEGYAIRVTTSQVDAARKSFPRSMYGFPVFLTIDGNRVPWSPPTLPTTPVPAWAQKKCI